MDRKKVPAWFDAECYQKRTQVIQLLHKTKSSNTDELRTAYNFQRRNYKNMLKEKRASWVEEESKEVVRKATENHFAALKIKPSKFANAISMATWEKHFQKLLNNGNAPLARNTQEIVDFPKITVEEVRETVKSLKNHKAAGPDEIFNEHLKEALPYLEEIWMVLLNKCLETSTIPANWRTSMLKVLYKGKGSPDSPDSYRGIALENTTFKMFSKIITNRLTNETLSMIPDRQFGFRKGRSTLQAIRLLREDISEALRHRGKKFHTIFIDYRKAFDLLDRELVTEKLRQSLGNDNYLTGILSEILQHNTVIISDNLQSSAPIVQTKGVLQGDPASPLLFNLTTADVEGILEGFEELVSFYAYADDMLLGSSNLKALQECWNRLTSWALKNKIQLNRDKTVHMVFRKGGRIAAEEKIYHEGKPLEIVKYFNYLGITLQTSGNTFTKHVDNRTTAAIIAMNDIKLLGRMSINTAMKIFSSKIIPIMTYGIEIFWDSLDKSSLNKIEKVKSTFLKKILCVSKYTPSRLTYQLTGEPFLIEDLRLKMLLPATDAYGKLLDELRDKREAIWLDFYSTEAMVNPEWKGPDYELRHIWTRCAVHGFHHRVCMTKAYHTPAVECICKLCGKRCDRYHALSCERRPSLKDLCSDQEL